MPRVYLAEDSYGGSPHIFLATAAYQFHPNYTHSLARSMLALREAGIGVTLCHVADDVHVDDARNAMVRQFLLSKAEALIFIDNDVGWEPETLLKLISYDRDVVAGVYPLKDMMEGYPVEVEGGKELWADKDGLVEVVGLPTGFMKIKRHVLEKMHSEEPRKFVGRGQDKDEIPHAVIFERTYDEGGRKSGDYAFCAKWRKMGGKLYADPEMHFTHSGTFEWAGTLGDHWKRVHGLKDKENEAKFAAAIQALRADQPSLDVFNDLQAGWSNTKWAAQASLLFTCYKAAKKNAGEILELGSGLSSLVMALACEGTGTVHSLEHDPIWASKLHQACRKYGIKNLQVRLCPMKDYKGGSWYWPPKDLPASFSLVLNDGPPRVSGNRAVLYEVLGNRINGAPVIVDDAEDQKELQALKDWSAANGRIVTTLGKDRLFAISTVAKKESEHVRPE